MKWKKKDYTFRSWRFELAFSWAYLTKARPRRCFRTSRRWRRPFRRFSLLFFFCQNQNFINTPKKRRAKIEMVYIVRIWMAWWRCRWSERSRSVTCRPLWWAAKRPGEWTLWARWWGTRGSRTAVAVWAWKSTRRRGNSAESARSLSRLPESCRTCSFIEN
jgi:hypothetical protein